MINSIISLFLESTPDPQCGAIIEKYKDRFLACIDARAIARRLEMKEVIPNRLSFRIENSAPEDANDLLFLHLQSHSSLVNLHKLCDVMTSMSGYPNMNKLGSTMKEDLPSVGYVDESNEYTSYPSPCLFGNLWHTMYSPYSTCNTLLSSQVCSSQSFMRVNMSTK